MRTHSRKKGATKRRRRRLSQDEQSSRQRLAMTLEHVSQGVCMFDAEQRLIFCNSKYAELYQLSEEITRPGITLREILEARLAKESGPFRENYIE